MATSVRFKLPFGAAMTHVATGQCVAALTFDDGPHPAHTPRLLELLGRYQARATFFMVGEAVRQHPYLVRQVAEAGHAVANHSWSHPSFHAISPWQRWRQVRQCQQFLAPYGQPLFRPPYGHCNRAFALESLWLRHQVVLWNLDSRDWQDPSPQTIATRLVEGIRPGSIVLLHDGNYDPTSRRSGDDRPQGTLRAMALCLEQLAGQFTFVTVPELREYGRAVYHP
jgi:peptidoglycan/xylan/chitin deacetylase (PgdA/CDA1 family)